MKGDFGLGQVDRNNISGHRKRQKFIVARKLVTSLSVQSRWPQIFLGSADKKRPQFSKMYTFNIALHVNTTINIRCELMKDTAERGLNFLKTCFIMSTEIPTKIAECAQFWCVLFKHKERQHPSKSTSIFDHAFAYTGQQ